MSMQELIAKIIAEYSKDANGNNLPVSEQEIAKIYGLNHGFDGNYSQLSENTDANQNIEDTQVFEPTE